MHRRPISSGFIARPIPLRYVSSNQIRYCESIPKNIEIKLHIGTENKISEESLKHNYKKHK